MLDRSISRRYRWKVQGRMAVLEYAAAHGMRPAAARFGLDRKTVRAWRSCLREAGTAGLVPRYPKRRRRRIPDQVVELIATLGASLAGVCLPDPLVAVARASGEGRSRNDLEDLR